MRNVKGRKTRGLSYQKRVTEINRIYDHYAKLGVPNREIWRRYVYPAYAISERQFYNILNASADPRNEISIDEELFLDFSSKDCYGGKRERTEDSINANTEGYSGGHWR